MSLAAIVWTLSDAIGAALLSVILLIVVVLWLWIRLVRAWAWWRERWVMHQVLRLPNDRRILVYRLLFAGCTPGEIATQARVSESVVREIARREGLLP